MPFFMLVIAFVVTGVVGCLSAMAGQVYERRKWERRLLEHAGGLRGPDALPDERMARMEQAVDAIAIELERVGEGQRFVTKLLADRSGHTERSNRSPQPGSIPASPRSTS